MKRLLAVLLAFVMVFAALPVMGASAEKEYSTPADAYTGYDADAVAAGEVADLTYDQIAAIVLDYVDRKIAVATQDFDTFEIDVLGQPVSVELDISNLDGILSYAGYISQLGGDFANLDITALNGLSRAGGDINFIYSIVQFVADNADVFGKVFRWDEGETFDFGEVGTYIESLDAEDEIRIFYEDYLIGNDIQQKFTDEIAREMGYTPAEGETLDDVINNGILDVVTGVFAENGLLSDEAVAAVKADFNLRDTDIYTLIKEFVGVIQSDNQVKIDTYYTFYLDNYVRTALKVAFGAEPVVGDAVSDAQAVTAEFNAAYPDMAMLYDISAGTVYFRASDGVYYVFTVTDTAITAVNYLTWTDTLAVNFEPPTVGIYTKASGTPDLVLDTSYNCALLQTYYPTDENYDMFTYSPYGEALDGSGLTVNGTAVPDEFTALMTEANHRDMTEFFAIAVKQGDAVTQSRVITFDEIETYAEAQALDLANQQAQAMGATVTGVDVVLHYDGWSTDDEFIVQVTATATVSATIDYQGMKIPVNNIDVSEALHNPVATVVVDSLAGSDGVLDAFELLNFFDTDFAVNKSFLDFYGNYDAYDGVIGQANHIVCSLLDMLLTEDGYAQLGLVDGRNDNLTANLQKLCTKLDSAISAAKEFMDEQGFVDFMDSTGINSLFASSHGFNAQMVYDLDFSSVESVYVCVAEIALDFIDDETTGDIHDIHTAIEGLETLDQIAVALTDYALDKALPELDEIIGGINAKLDTSFVFDYTVPVTDAAAVTDNAKDIIMKKLADFGLSFITFAVDDVANTLINTAIDEINTEFVLDIGHVDFVFGVTASDNWQTTLDAVVDRIIALTDGMLIAAGNIPADADVYDKLSIIGNSLIPFSTMFSNCSSEAYGCDFEVLSDIFFNDALAGNLDSFLALFEANNAISENKPGDLAVGVPVTYALIKASDYIVDSFFPDTVKAELYTPGPLVQDTFTSAASDAGIAARNMVSINARKVNIVPCALDLVRESGILPSLVVPCAHENTADVAALAATCIAEGYTAGVYCNDCERFISGHITIAVDSGNHVGTITPLAAVAADCCHTGLTAGTHCSACDRDVIAQTVTPVDPANHTGTEDVAAVAVSCTADGFTAGVRCTGCGVYISGHELIAATGHSDANGDGVCDVCSIGLVEPEPEPAPEPTFIQKIAAFFQRIMDWFQNLFK